MTTSTTIAQNNGQETTRFTNDNTEYGVGINNIIYANQIFIEHKSLYKQVGDLNKYIETIRAQMELDKIDKQRIQMELDARKEILETKENIYNITLAEHSKEVTELKKKNVLPWIVAVIATAVTIISLSN